MICTQEFILDAKGHFDAVNITDRIKDFIRSSKIQDGNVLVHYLHTTGAVVVMEHEAGIVADLEKSLDTLFPENATYLHHLRNVDDNGCSHIRSIFLGANVLLPVHKGQLLIGEYQEIVILDMQTGQKPRHYLLQVNGE